MSNSRKRARDGNEPGFDHEEDEPFDVVKFQAEMDGRLASARALVDSWVPTNLDSAWKEAERNLASSVSSLAALESQSRPPRLGLGASVSAYHVQQAEDRKLRNQLLGHARKHKPRDEGDATSSTLKTNGSADTGADSEEDEDSRTRAIKAVKKADDPFVLNGNKQAATKLKPAVVAPIVSAAARTRPSHAEVSGNGGKSGQLTKNQRKKERERVRKLAAQEAKLAEIRKEEQGAEVSGGDGEAQPKVAENAANRGPASIDMEGGTEDDDEGADMSDGPTDEPSSSPAKRRRRRRRNKIATEAQPSTLLNLGS
ncbi:hypothetical protein ACM66B_005810 [Microbotryomycetes sp. NB124-2]